jgi:T4 RnlA family RNA ligase
MNLPSPEFFIFRDCQIGGDDCVLINPTHSDGSGIWTPETLRFRSIILRKSDHKVISQGWPKFFNYGQAPQLYPDPAKYNDWQIDNKEDGSAVYISKHNGELVIRTRGSFNYFQQPNAAELTELLEQPDIKYFVDCIEDGYTYLWEWLSPTNKIVLLHEKPRLVFLGAMHNEDAIYIPISNGLAKSCNLDVPEKFTFNSIAEIVANCKTLKGREGYVLSYNGGQNRVKLKGDDYIARHRLKSSFDNFDHIVDFWIELEEPPYEPFFECVCQAVDYETAKYNEKNLQKIVEIGVEKHRVLNQMSETIFGLAGKSRKEQALEIVRRFGKLASFAFIKLDGKEFTKEIHRKMFDAVLEK